MPMSATVASLAREDEAKFRKDRAAWADWERRPPGYRKVVLHWVTSAKKPETRAKRLATLIACSAAGERFRTTTWAEEMITVTGPLWLWTGENGSWHFVTIPDEQSDEIRAHCLAAMRGFGSARVEVTHRRRHVADVGLPA